MRMRILCEWYFFHWTAGIAIHCIVAAKHRYNAYDAHRVCFMGGHFIHLSSIRSKLKMQKILQVQWTHTRTTSWSRMRCFFSIFDFRICTKLHKSINHREEEQWNKYFHFIYSMHVARGTLQLFANCNRRMFCSVFSNDWTNEKSFIKCVDDNDTYAPIVLRIVWSKMHSPFTEQFDTLMQGILLFSWLGTEFKFRAKGLYIYASSQLPNEWGWISRSTTYKYLPWPIEENKYRAPLLAIVGLSIPNLYEFLKWKMQFGFFSFS